MKEVLLDTLFDTLKAIPILFFVYLLLEFLEIHTSPARIFSQSLEKFGPLLGALVGCVPQCGFSAAAASLYKEGVISAGTLIAVFLSTSDEAVPIMLANFSNWRQIFLLLGMKIIIALIAGYLLRWTVFRKEKLAEIPDFAGHSHKHNATGLFRCALRRTIQISAFIGVVSLLINLIVFFIGDDHLNQFLLTDTPFQPLLTALIGLIPGCAASVLLTELYLSSSISFGAAVAGLSAGTGFGYLVLFQQCKRKKNMGKIVLWTYLTAALSGTIIHLLIG